MGPQHAAELLRSSDALLRADRYRDALACVLQVFESADRYPELLIPLCQRLQRFHESGRALSLVAKADPGRFATRPAISTLRATSPSAACRLTGRCGSAEWSNRARSAAIPTG